MSKFKVGDKVRHELMGDGVVVSPLVHVQFGTAAGEASQVPLSSLTRIEPERRCTCGELDAASNTFLRLVLSEAEEVSE